MKKLSWFFAALAVILSNIMCAVIAYNYRSLLCSIEHAGFSAPAEIAFFSAIPFSAGIAVCIFFAIKFHKKHKSEK